MEASRIANVAAAVGVEASSRGRALRVARLCRMLFEEVLWVDDEAPAPADCRWVRTGSGEDRLGAAAAATQAERLIWIDASEGSESLPEADALLALVAWPERDVVQPVDEAGRPLSFAIHRRAVCPGIAAMPAANAPAVERVSLALLGLADGWTSAVFAGSGSAE